MIHFSSFGAPPAPAIELPGGDLIALISGAVDINWLREEDTVKTDAHLEDVKLLGLRLQVKMTWALMPNPKYYPAGSPGYFIPGTEALLRISDAETVGFSLTGKSPFIQMKPSSAKRIIRNGEPYQTQTTTLRAVGLVKSSVDVEMDWEDQ